MSTVRELFRDSIATADWDGITKVFELITGEKAPAILRPEPKPSPLDIVLDMPVGPIPRDNTCSQHPSNSRVRVHAALPSEEEVEEFEQAVAEAGIEVGGVVIFPDTLPIDEPLTSDTVETDDFSIQHGTPDGSEYNEDGEKKCRREPIRQGKRDNRFTDEQTEHRDELVTEHPELGGKPLIKPSGTIRQSEGHIDTSKTVRVQCGLCNNWEDIVPMLATRYNSDPEQNTYRCNTCTSPNGRSKVLRQQRNDELNGGSRRRRTA